MSRGADCMSVFVCGCACTCVHVHVYVQHVCMCYSLTGHWCTHAFIIVHLILQLYSCSCLHASFCIIIIIIEPSYYSKISITFISASCSTEAELQIIINKASIKADFFLPSAISTNAALMYAFAKQVAIMPNLAIIMLLKLDVTED